MGEHEAVKVGGAAVLAVLVKKTRKAILAGVATLVGAIGTACLDGQLTTGEAVAAAGAALVAAAGVYEIRNAR